MLSVVCGRGVLRRNDEDAGTDIADCRRLDAGQDGRWMDSPMDGHLEVAGGDIGRCGGVHRLLRLLPTDVACGHLPDELHDAYHTLFGERSAASS